MAVKIKPSSIDVDKLKSVRPDEATVAAMGDPIDKIMVGMQERGFECLWTDSKDNAHLTAFDDRRKLAFLRKYAVTGRLAFAAACSGVSRYTVNTHRRKDPVFNEAVREAADYFRDQLEAEMYRRGVEGYEEGVVGGRNRDQVIMVPKYSDRMLELLGRVHMPELRKEVKEIQAGSITINNDNSTTKVTQFDFSSMPPEDLAILKVLLENQAKRQDQEKVINGEVVNNA